LTVQPSSARLGFPKVAQDAYGRFDGVLGPSAGQAPVGASSAMLEGSGRPTSVPPHVEATQARKRQPPAEGPGLEGGERRLGGCGRRRGPAPALHGLAPGPPPSPALWPGGPARHLGCRPVLGRVHGRGHRRLPGGGRALVRQGLGGRRPRAAPTRASVSSRGEVTRAPNNSRMPSSVESSPAGAVAGTGCSGKKCSPDRPCCPPAGHTPGRRRVVADLRDGAGQQGAPGRKNCRRS
jgi:hypothetical protein